MEACDPLLSPSVSFDVVGSFIEIDSEVV